jgi:hypothetical protein
MRPLLSCSNREVQTRLEQDNHPYSKSEEFPVPVAMDEMAALTLANICLDVQIGICMFLHPSDILALRKVCRLQKFSLLKSVKYYYQDL